MNPPPPVSVSVVTIIPDPPVPGQIVCVLIQGPSGGSAPVVDIEQPNVRESEPAQPLGGDLWYVCFIMPLSGTPVTISVAGDGTHQVVLLR